MNFNKVKKNKFEISFNRLKLIFIARLKKIYRKIFVQSKDRLYRKSLKLIHSIRYKTPAPNKLIDAYEYAVNTMQSNNKIDEGFVINRKPPLTIDQEIHWKFTKEYERSIRGTYCIELTNAIIAPDKSIFTADGFLLKDVSMQLDKKPEDLDILHSGNLPKVIPCDFKIAVIENPLTGNNYFHFLFDTLPRLSLIKEISVIDKYYLSSNLDFKKKYLQLLGINDNQIIEPFKGYCLKPKSTIIPSLIGNTGNPTSRSVNFLKSFIKKIPNTYRTKLKTDSKKIYISRKNAQSRKLLNEDDAISFLIKKGFSIVFLENLDVYEQIALFAQAECVIGIHGAGLSNIVYTPENCQIVELFAPEYVNVCYWSLANLCKQNYGYLIGQGIKYQPGYDPTITTADIIINLRDLENLMTKMSL